MSENTSAITPSNVSFNLDAQELPITDAQLTVTFFNNCCYVPGVLPNGKKGYLLKKGAEVTRDGDFTVQTTSTGDGKSEDAIKTLKEMRDLAHKHRDPKEYTKAATFAVQSPGGKQVAAISFGCFVPEYKENNPKGTEPVQAQARLEPHDPMSVDVKA